MANTIAPSPRFPIEVIERVIDSVHNLFYEEDINLLGLHDIWRACALTCHAMTPRSQFWLFRQVGLDSYTRAMEFTEILRMNPGVARHVQALGLVGPYNNMRSGRPRGQDDTWMSWIPLVLAPRLKNLQHLELSDGIFLDCHPNLPAALATFKTIRKLSINRVTFPSFQHLTGLIRAFPRLRHLTTDEISWKPDHLDLHPLARGKLRYFRQRQVKLAHLDIVYDESSTPRIFVKWLMDSGAVKFLVTLSAFGEMNDIPRLIMTRASRIQSMLLICRRDIPVRVRTNALDHLEMMYLLMNSGKSPIQFLTAVALSEPRQLHEVTFFLGKNEATMPIKDDELAAYTELDAALNKPVLRKLNMTMWLEEGASIELMNQFEQSLMERLPTFSSIPGRLRVKQASIRNLVMRWLMASDKP